MKYKSYWQYMEAMKQYQAEPVGEQPTFEEPPQQKMSGTEWFSYRTKYWNASI